MTTQQCTINSWCRRGGNVNHSCRQCLKHTLERYGIDAEAWDREVLREGARQSSRAWRHRDDSWRDLRVFHRNRRRNYGLTEAAYAALLRVQEGVCALCGQPETRRTRKGALLSLSVDHDHSTGVVRGLLCTSCNQAIGFLEMKGIGWLRQAEVYLRTHRSPFWPAGPFGSATY